MRALNEVDSEQKKWGNYWNETAGQKLLCASAMKSLQVAVHEACELAKQDPELSFEEIRTWRDKMLFELLWQAWYERGTAPSGQRLSSPTDSMGCLKDYIARYCKADPLWRETEEELERLLEWIVNRPAEPVLAPTLGRPDVPSSPSHRQRITLPETEETKQERADRRQDFVMPRLKKKSRNKWADESAVGKNTVYEYLDGTRKKLSDVNRQAMADALGVSIEELPE